ncbi:uncharacterized protein BO96DRAFT_329072 [Aspergillus niger CBS 101883]|uniref:Uncharacterized protein n=3 Tax=Aspergillus niger TaxID=5061 RepID=A2QEL9_ASPNC|nr:uncharacterized protein BO96DRAFT_329072 [Aspergillus niger CBS 101883]XP_059603515.1 hypothetical protein An02g11540 [Aspergillus niger]PYH59908.1 hypothetical protein BO96DRAFT_329072 [Aspergillus niger CBS 101883]RDH23160.1 hypothetical protein M747DRAFT_231779 [Aspergillus niger ATCC 13496]CAK44480.1 hypothetical protein An02g11540 [Aspergillus niger]
MGFHGIYSSIQGNSTSHTSAYIPYEPPDCRSIVIAESRGYPSVQSSDFHPSESDAIRLQFHLRTDYCSWIIWTLGVLTGYALKRRCLGRVGLKLFDRIPAYFDARDDGLIRINLRGEHQSGEAPPRTNQSDPA